MVEANIKVIVKRGNLVAQHRFTELHFKISKGKPVLKRIKEMLKESLELEKHWQEIEK